MKINSFLRLSLFTSIIVILIIFLQYVRVTEINTIIAPVQNAEASFHLMTDEKPEKNSNLKLYIYEDHTALSKSTSNNLKMALTYAKISFESIKLDQIDSLSPSPYTVLLLTSENSEALPKDSIQNFVKKGGRLFVANRFLNKDWDSIVGIRENNEFHEQTVYGMDFEKKFFPGYPDLTSNDEIYDHSILDVTLEDNASVYLTSENHPLLWTYPFGKGKITYWNTTSMNGKNSRGILLQSLGLTVPAFVTGQAGIMVMFIDDFPAPIGNEKVHVLEENDDMSIREFYKNIWWKDHLQYADKLGLKYSAVLIGTYRDDDKLTSDQLIKLHKNNMDFFGRDLLEAGGEIGIHGYNHQSLVTEEEPTDQHLGYVPWTNQAQMEKGLRSTNELFHHYFPNMELRSYVPPSNIINKTGINAIHNSLPSVNTISSLYVGKSEKGSLVEEFEFDPAIPDLYHFPRISSGYFIPNELKYIINDGIANFGVVSHFVHPDDILDPKRSQGLKWSEISKRFENHFQKTLEMYPYLEPLTISDAREKMILYQNAQVNVHYRDNEILISGESMLNPSHFLVRLEEGKALEEGNYSFGKVNLLQDSDNLYEVTMTKPKAVIPIKEG